MNEILRCCVFLFQQCLKVKHGRKGGPPPTRRCPMRQIRMPARLIDDSSDSLDSSDSSDHDTAPAIFRTIIRDLQRQLQETQTQLTEARSSDDRSPPVTTPASAPTPNICAGPSNSGAKTQTFKPCWLVSCNRCREQPSSGPNKVSQP